MKPVPFKESNIILSAGDNPNTDDMPAAVSIHLNGDGTKLIPFTISFWKFDPEELEEANRNGGVWIAAMYLPPPPIMLMAFNPFKHHGFVSLDAEELIRLRKESGI